MSKNKYLGRNVVDVCNNHARFELNETKLRRKHDFQFDFSDMPTPLVLCQGHQNWCESVKLNVM